MPEPVFYKRINISMVKKPTAIWKCHVLYKWCFKILMKEGDFMKKKGNKEMGVKKISWMKMQSRATNTKSVSNRIYNLNIVYLKRKINAINISKYFVLSYKRKDVIFIVLIKSIEYEEINYSVLIVWYFIFNKKGNIMKKLRKLLNIVLQRENNLKFELDVFLFHTIWFQSKSNFIMK